MKKQLLAMVIAATGLFGLAGCGGGGGGGAAPAPVSQAIDGIWIGTLTSTPVAQTFGIIGVIAPNHQLRFISTAGVQYFGRAAVAGNRVTAAVTGIAPAGFIFLSGGNTTTGNISGTVVASTSLNGTYTAINDSGTFSLTYSPTYNRPASLSLLAKTWTGAISSGGIATITISPGGVISGTDTMGCSYAGTVSVIDPAKNIYNATVTASVCAPTATYTGYAILQDVAPGTNNQIDFIVGNATRSVFGALQ